MNVNCNIIRDLLPLYAEGMASEESKALVDDHLRGCDSCTKELAELKKAPRIPAEVETTSLRRVENAIRRRKLLTAATAMLTLAAVLVTGFIFLLTPVCLTRGWSCGKTEPSQLIIQAESWATAAPASAVKTTNLSGAIQPDMTGCEANCLAPIFQV